MSRYTRFCLLFLLLINHITHAQRLEEILNETITVNSQTSMSGSTRNVAEIQLPAGTSSYTYRISISRRGGRYTDNSLLSLLQTLPLTQVSLGANLAQYAINQSDGSQIDFFIFTTSQDKDAFQAKSEGWISCRSFLNRVNTCGHVNKCLNETVWFGFRNNNLSQGLDVQLEVVALINESSTNQAYSFQIVNKTQADMQFELSTDGLSWQPCSLRSGYMGNWKFTQPTVQFRLKTANQAPVRYNMLSTERYQIKWNDTVQRWDLFNY